MGKNLVSYLRSVTIESNPGQYVKGATGEFRPVMNSQLWKTVDKVAAALLALGIKRGAHIGIISDNRPEWLYSDLAILSLGASDAPRGSDSTADEIHYILEHSDSIACFAENPIQCEKILQKPLSRLKHVILFDDYPEINDRPKKNNISIMTFKELLGPETKRVSDAELSAARDLVTEEDTASIIYTSGTTGIPKGVMLSHKNFLFEVEKLAPLALLNPGNTILSILPIWHSFERIANYLALGCNTAIGYSKPVATILLPDMAAIKPQVIATVPRIWENIYTGIYRNIKKDGGIKAVLFRFFVAVSTVYCRIKNFMKGESPQYKTHIRIFDIIISLLPLIILLPFHALGNLLVYRKIKQRLGGSFLHGVSGGSALPKYISDFFQAVGITILEGYGMTETSPVIAVSSPNGGIVYNTVGYFLDNVQYKILDTNNRPVAKTEVGVLFIKSNQTMQGYYKDPQLTREILDKDGWLNTGDLVLQTKQGALKIVGRSKDTIVLLSGENVEPSPIEEKICQSRYIDYAIVLGNEQKFLGALVVPNEEQMIAIAKNLGIPYTNFSEFSRHPELKKILIAEIQSLIHTRNGFRKIEQITKICIADRTWEIDRELSKVLKVKRHEIQRVYKKEIETLFTPI